MKHSTVTLKVTLEVIVPVELEDEDDFAPEVQAERDIRNTSIRDWWTSLSAEHEIVDVQVVTIEAEPVKVCRHVWYSTNPQWDMQAFCTICGERET